MACLSLNEVNQAIIQENYVPEIAAVLLDYGAHLDVPDSMGLTPLDILKTHPAKLKPVQVRSGIILFMIISQSIKFKLTEMIAV